MKTTSKEMSTLTKVAKSELTNVVRSPFQITNFLNRVARGDINKVTGLEGIDVTALQHVAKEVKKLHNNKRYYFDLCVFDRNSVGAYCEKVTAKGHAVRERLTCDQRVSYVWTDENGHELTEDGRALRPIACTAVAFFAAFARAAKVAIQTTEKAEKAAEKAAKKAAKEAEKAAKVRAKAREIFGDYVDTLSDSDLLSRIKALKAA